jgi:membrane protein
MRLAPPQLHREQPHTTYRLNDGLRQPVDRKPELDGKHSLLKGTYARFKKVGVTNWAAALTYYGVLALFPAIIAVVSILGLIGESATQPLLDNISTMGPGPAQEILTNAVTGVQSGGSSGAVFAIGVALAIWAASGYVGAFMDASNAIYEVDETRSVFKKIPLRVAVTTTILTLVVLCSFALVLTGDIAQRAGDIFGVGSRAVDAWEIVKYPVVLALVAFLIGLLYWTAPNVSHAGFRWITAGSLLAVGIWVLASIAFAFYVANFGSYNQTYGTLGGAVIFLVWLWITNIAVLLGAALNAERELAASAIELPAEKETS